MTAILSGLAVDTVALRQLAERIRQAAAHARLGANDHAATAALVTGLSTPVLVQAAGSFLERWGGALAELVDDAHRLADAIDLVARSYQDVEGLTERGIGG